MIVLVGFPNHGVMWVKVSKVIQRLRKVTQRDLDFKVSRNGFNTLRPFSAPRCRFHLTKFLTAFGKCSPILLQFFWAVYNTEPFKIQTVLEAKRYKGYQRIISEISWQNDSAFKTSLWLVPHDRIHQSSQKSVENRHVQNISLTLYIR